MTLYVLPVIFYVQSIFRVLKGQKKRPFTIFEALNLDDFLQFLRAKIMCPKAKLRASEITKTAVIKLQESSKFISRKIRVSEKVPKFSYCV